MINVSNLLCRDKDHLIALDLKSKLTCIVITIGSLVVMFVTRLILKDKATYLPDRVSPTDGLTSNILRKTVKRNQSIHGGTREPKSAESARKNERDNHARFHRGTRIRKRIQERSSGSLDTRNTIKPVKEGKGTLNAHDRLTVENCVLEDTNRSIRQLNRFIVRPFLPYQLVDATKAHGKTNCLNEVELRGKLEKAQLRTCDKHIRSKHEVRTLRNARIMNMALDTLPVSALLLG